MIPSEFLTATSSPMAWHLTPEKKSTKGQPEIGRSPWEQLRGENFALSILVQVVLSWCKEPTKGPILAFQRYSYFRPNADEGGLTLPEAELAQGAFVRHTVLLCCLLRIPHLGSCKRCTLPRNLRMQGNFMKTCLKPSISSCDRSRLRESISSRPYRRII